MNWIILFNLAVFFKYPSLISENLLKKGRVHIREFGILKVSFYKNIEIEDKQELKQGFKLLKSDEILSISENNNNLIDFKNLNKKSTPSNSKRILKLLLVKKPFS